MFVRESQSTGALQAQAPKTIRPAETPDVSPLRKRSAPQGENQTASDVARSQEPGSANDNATRSGASEASAVETPQTEVSVSFNEDAGVYVIKTSSTSGNGQTTEHQYPTEEFVAYLKEVNSDDGSFIDVQA